MGAPYIFSPHNIDNFSAYAQTVSPHMYNFIDTPDDIKVHLAT